MKSFSAYLVQFGKLALVKLDFTFDLPLNWEVSTKVRFIRKMNNFQRAKKQYLLLEEVERE